MNSEQDKPRFCALPLERRVVVRLTDSEIKTLIGLLKMMDATSDDRDQDYRNFGILKRKFLKATGME